MRKTKIICTIGPACESEEMLRGLMEAGMNVARLNFSHGSHEEHLPRIERIKKLRSELELPIGILLDTKGPEYRIGRFGVDKVVLREGDTFTLTTADELGDQTHVSVSYKGLCGELEVGDTVLVCNGLVVMEVLECDADHATCVVKAGGELSDRKSMAVPNKVFKQPYLSEQDRKDILFGAEHGVDFIACSFVSCKQDLLDVRALLEENGYTDIDLIAKIENRSGVDNIESICEACDGIMVARGDLGVEIPFEELPAIQKQLITTARLLGKRVITATEMLESMITNIRPTRAEISDVANAVYDGTSAIMLSGETSVGKHPILVVETMSRIAEKTEKDINYVNRFRHTEFRIHNIMDAISHSVCSMAIDIHARCIAVNSLSGMTARMVSRFRSPVDILCLTTREKTWCKLSLSWGVTPVMTETFQSTDVLFYNAKNLARQQFSLKKGDTLVMTGGLTKGVSGNTDTLKVEMI